MDALWMHAAWCSRFPKRKYYLQNTSDLTSCSTKVGWILRCNKGSRLAVLGSWWYQVLSQVIEIPRDLSLSLFTLHLSFSFPLLKLTTCKQALWFHMLGLSFPTFIYVQYAFPVAICEMCTKESWVESLMWWRYANLAIHSFALQGSAQTRKDLEQAMKSSWLLQSLKTWQIQTVRITQGNAL